MTSRFAVGRVCKASRAEGRCVGVDNACDLVLQMLGRAQKELVHSLINNNNFFCNNTTLFRYLLLLLLAACASVIVEIADFRSPEQNLSNVLS